MIPRLLRNPAALILGAVAVLSVLAAAWSLGTLIDYQGYTWTGEPTEAQIWQERLMRAANAIPPSATMVAIAATLGVIVIGAATSRRRQRSTRTTSEAGSTENRAAVTTPNSSPSISTSSGSPSIEMSTERPRA